MLNAEGCSSQNQLSCTTSNVYYGNNTKFINNATFFFREISFRTFPLHVKFTVLHRASSSVHCCLKIDVIKERRPFFFLFVKFLSLSFVISFLISLYASYFWLSTFFSLYPSCFFSLPSFLLLRLLLS